MDIWVDGTAVVKDSTFKDVSDYISLPVGPHAVAVRPTGATAGMPATATGTATVSTGTAITGAIVQEEAGLRLEMLSDNLSAPPTGEAKVRIIQSAPNLGAVSASLTPLATTPSPAVQSAVTAIQIPNIAFASASAYTPLASGTYQLVVNHPGSSQVLVSGDNLPVSAGAVVSVVVLGASTGPTIEVLSDAIGAAALPVGGMQTGEGGTAGGTAHPLPLLPVGGAAIAVLAIVGLGLRRRGSRLSRVTQ